MKSWEGEGKAGLEDSCKLVSYKGLTRRSCSGEVSDSSVIKQSVRSLSLKVGGLESVLFLFGGRRGVDLSGEEGGRRGRVGCCTG
jgi:hypothetical protein